MQCCIEIRRLPLLPALLFASVMVAGCATTPEEPVTAEPPPVPVIVPAPAPASIPVVKDPPPVPDVPTVTSQPLPPVAIVLASRQPAYEAVVTELEKHFENYSIYDFGDKSQPPVTAFRAINDRETAAVIAIGLRAAQSAVALSKSPVIFSQVFNYQDHGLVTANSRGVAAISPLDAQLAAWKKLDPAVNEVGLIIGGGHERLLEDAQQAADRYGIQLHVQISHSDQETLFYYKRMVADIDGFWLLPDNRVLSARVIREILADATRRNVAVVVPSDTMLSIGAAISITTTASNIAEKIVDVVRMIQAGRFAEAADITPLTEIKVTTNDKVMQKRVVASKLTEARGTSQ